MSARTFAVGATIAAALSAVVAGWRTGAVPDVAREALEGLERQTLDLRFQLRGPRPASEAVVLVAIDDRTLSEAPELFERRAGQARIVRAVKDGGAKVLGVDLLFTDPEQLLAPDLVADVDAWVAANGATTAPDGAAPSTGAEEDARGLLERVQAEVHGDDELAAAIKEAGNVVLAFHVGSRGNEPPRELSRGKYGQVSAGGQLPAPGTRVLASHAMFNRAASRLGAITTFEDVGGSVRDVPIALALGESLFVPMALQLVAAHEGVSRGAVAFVGEDGSAHLGDRVVRGQQGRLLLNWRGADYTTVSAVDLVRGDVEPGVLDGRIAILGFTHLAQDAVVTPWGRRPGYLVHATAVDNVLAGDPLRRASPAVDVVLALLVGLLVSVVFVPRQVSPVARVAGALAIVLGGLIGCHVAFAEGRLWISALGPLSSGVSATLGCFAAAYLQEGVQKRYLRTAFAHYLSDDLVEELVADPSRVSLTGERRELTVLFSDIRNFTTFSEKLAPLDLAEFLKAYFTPMTRAVLDNAGYVDKFIGDAVMALFGAPVRHDRHAAEACEAVLAMHAALTDLRPIAARYGIDLDLGAGLNTGEMVVGNMGSAERFDYTVLGDAVNLGSRLEGLTKVYGVFCLVGQRTAELAGTAFTFRPIDLVRVKGKGEPVAIFELCAGPSGAIARYEAVDDWLTAIAAFRGGDLAGARDAFRRFAAANPDDAVARLYLDRLDALGDAAPAGWDGVFVHTKK